MVVCLTAGCASKSEPVPESASQGSQILPDGVFAVIRESSTEAEARVDGVSHVVMLYDRKYSDADRNEPPRYIVIDPSSSVPLVIEGKPDMVKDGEGHSVLSITLPRENIKALEDFTREHLGGKIAIVCDGEIITLHKVRSVIHEGKVQIARCDDNACEILRTKLSND
jgi:preprotein translocase subunit SecD